MTYIVPFSNIRKEDYALVGGKGANIGHLVRSGLPVPDGFCLTTHFYTDWLQTSERLPHLLEALDALQHPTIAAIEPIATRIQDELNALPFPERATRELHQQLNARSYDAYAIRSSAVAEDLPSASFAGQQDTFLHIQGNETIERYVRACGASLFNTRAILYRMQQGIPHDGLRMAILLQQMVVPDVSGIAFTANPVNGRRDVVLIDASYGLGEAIVSGNVSPDAYVVKNRTIIEKTIGSKRIELVPDENGATKEVPVSPKRQHEQALSATEIIELSELAQKIEHLYGAPQDIEWGLAGDDWYVFQSRPITSLYPLPHGFKRTDAPHLFINFHYIQGMMDPIRPFGLSFIQEMLRIFTRKIDDHGPGYRAGGRLFIDATIPLATPYVRDKLIDALRDMDESLARALVRATETESFQTVKVPLTQKIQFAANVAPAVTRITRDVKQLLKREDPEHVNEERLRWIREETHELERTLQKKSGIDRLELIRASAQTILRDGLSFVVGPYVASRMLRRRLMDELQTLFGNDEGASMVRTLEQALPGNVASKMGLALADLAFLANDPAYEAIPRGTPLEDVAHLPNGPAFIRKMKQFLHTYGMRGPREIDMTEPRWHEDWTMLLPMMQSITRGKHEATHRTDYRRAQQEALAALRNITERVPPAKRTRLHQMMRQFRFYSGMRDHHKFALIQWFDVYRRMMLEEAAALVEDGIFDEVEDGWALTLDEWYAGMKGAPVPVRRLVDERKEAFRLDTKRRPPRVLRSDGRMWNGAPDVNPHERGVWVGTPVSPGVVEGRVRHLLDPNDPSLERGDILLTRYTDPSWTPLFIGVSGLITEVGGLMTHGSVVAREYGLPAVVGIDHALDEIPDGAFVRLNGTAGTIEWLDRPAP
ncbi:MAG TPA: PEP/pyruvate-binding domain-containing protein [Savagea sp.]